MNKLIAIDPGTNNAGIAFFEDKKLIESKQLKFNPKTPLYTRLRALKQAVEAFLSNKGHINHFAIETPYIGRNPQSGLKLGQARGVILCIIFNKNSEIIDISPQEVRSHYSVPPRSKKQDYQKIVKLEFNKKDLGEDEADAIAIGSTALSKLKVEQLQKIKDKQ